MEETKRYKWTDSATKLLVSIWANSQVQEQLRASSRTLPLWNSIARFMSKRGYPVSGLQCRTRIKNMTGQYQAAATLGDSSQIQPYFDIFHSVISKKKAQEKQAVSKISASDLSPQLVYSDDCSEPEVLECCTEEDIKNAENIDSEETFAAAAESSSLENVIIKAVTIETQGLKQLVTESARSLEGLIRMGTEKILRVVEAEEQKRRDLEARLDRLIKKEELSAQKKGYDMKLT